MNRFRSTFGDLRPARRKFLSVFLTAGYPSSEMTVRLAAGVVEAGADVIEIGIPFSDPLADGPVIQRSSHQALAMHMTPAGVFSMVAEIRKSTGVPIILMGYVNPIFSRGMAAFMNDAMISGVDGMIIPDLPIEESAGYRQSAAKSGIAAVFMITPTTPDHRIVEIDRLSGGFVYA
ncbi:MAG TPA: tryptophan synthase subunit alpha, partial [Bacteroidota bacterium]|nr:tryptophan synthase subunit alpha [Bacteroidota bacterium]